MTGWYRIPASVGMFLVQLTYVVLYDICLVSQMKCDGVTVDLLFICVRLCLMFQLEV